jgi:hypothetical protein
MIHPISRIATVVGIGAAPSEQERWYCDAVVPRYCQAVHDLKVGDALNAAFGDRAK